MAEILDCGSHSCEFARDKTGQRNNGPCQCLKGLPLSRRVAIRNEIHRLQGEIERLRFAWQTGKPPKEDWYWIRHGHEGNGIPYIHYIDNRSDEMTGNCSVEELYYAGPIPEPAALSGKEEADE